MTKIFIKPGDVLSIGYLDDQGNPTDGEITVEYAKTSITVRTDWPDATGRSGVVYQELFGGEHDDAHDVEGEFSNAQAMVDQFRKYEATQKNALQPRVRVSGPFVYKLNAKGSNLWSALIQPGTVESGLRVSDTDCADVAALIAEVLNNSKKF